MKTFLSEILAYVLSGIYGITWLISVWSVRKAKSWPKSGIWVTGVFLLPVILVFGMRWREEAVTDQDWRYFQELCRAEAGDRILMTVNNVEGIFQMRPRESNNTTRLKSAATSHGANDQFGLVDPYGFAAGDDQDIHEAFLGRVDSYTLSTPRYLFVETLRTYDAPNAAPYRRYELTRHTKKGSGGQEGVQEFEVTQRLVDKLQSTYGYTWEDLSTREMRERWIAKGRILVKDLRTGEVLAERTGFVFAKHRNWTADLYPGVNADNRCPGQDLRSKDVQSFIFHVLKPKNQ